MKALTFIVRFQTAQFKVHFQKLTRRSYLIPPPSAVAGIFGAILGVPRTRLKSYCKERKILTGAELRNLEGYYATTSRIFKFDRPETGIIRLLEKWLKRPAVAYREVSELRPLKESEELFRPEYKLAIAAEVEVIEEVLMRLRELDFEYEVFGGNDYHFVEYVGDVRKAIFTKSREGAGYCPVEDVRQIDAREYRVVVDNNYLLERHTMQLPIVVSAPVGPEMEAFLFTYRASIVAKSERDAVQDEESTIFVFDPVRCLVSWTA